MYSRCVVLAMDIVSNRCLHACLILFLKLPAHTHAGKTEEEEEQCEYCMHGVLSQCVVGPHLF